LKPSFLIQPEASPFCKVAIITADWLDANSKYPHPGVVRRKVLSRSQDTQDREAVRVTNRKT
jgi:hypothetical protein